MKDLKLKSHFINTGLMGAVSVALLAGCGGSSSGGSGGGTIDSTLDLASIDVLSQKIVDVGSCVGVSGVSAPRQVSSRTDASGSGSGGNTLLGRPIDILINGLLGGTMEKSGEHQDGTDTMTYKYTNFTNPIGDIKLKVNGSAAVVVHGVPGDFGPVLSNKTFDTNDTVQIDKESNSVARASLASRITDGSYRLSVDGLNQTYATQLFDPDDFVAKTISLTDTGNGNVYKVSNVNGKGFYSNTQIAITDIGYTYDDPDEGTFTVSSENIVIGLDGMKMPSSIRGGLSVIATDGSKAEIDIDVTGNIKIFTVDAGGRTLASEIDCSGLVH